MKSPLDSQRGVATLAITMLLLFAMSLVALFANRSLLFEQRSSANQYRATRAFDAAEAGLEWATAMLNDPRAIDAQCLPDGSSASFRAKYVPVDGNWALQPTGDANPACRINAKALVCSCPEPNADPVLSGGDDATFSVSFAKVAGDPESVQVTSLGCTSLSPECVPGAIAGPADARSRASVILKLKPLLRVIPGAALTAGGTVELQGSTALHNTDRVTGGALVEAGGHVAADPTTRLTTLPGSPALAAMIDDEPSLDALSHQSDSVNGIFNAFFGMPVARYRTAGAVRIIRGSTAGARAESLMTFYRLGYDAFYADGPLDFDRAVIGTTERPLLIVAPEAVTCSQACVINGLIYNDTTQRDISGGAGVSVRGAVITRGDHRQASGDSVSYDVAALSALRQQASVFVRVPGSWRDF